MDALATRGHVISSTFEVFQFLLQNQFPIAEFTRAVRTKVKQFPRSFTVGSALSQFPFAVTAVSRLNTTPAKGRRTPHARTSAKNPVAGDGIRTRDH